MTNMTISQGLRNLKKLKGKLSEALSRALNSVSYKEGQEPAFDFKSLLEESDSLRRGIVHLETRIAATNSLVSISFDGRSMLLTEAVRELQELKSQLSWLRGLSVRSHSKSVENDWTYDDDGKRIAVQWTWHCALPEAERAALVGRFQDRFDALNDVVENTNHSRELVAL